MQMLCGGLSIPTIDFECPAMNPVTVKHDSNVILYDAALLSSISAEVFDPEWWEQQGKLTGTAPGRGTTFFIDMAFGPAVLRHYLRGGWAARVSEDRYWYGGVRRIAAVPGI